MADVRSSTLLRSTVVRGRLPDGRRPLCRVLPAGPEGPAGLRRGSGWAAEDACPAPMGRAGPAGGQSSSGGGVRFSSTGTVRSSSPHTMYRYFEVRIGVQVVRVM